jgi:hypothetical protein
MKNNNIKKKCFVGLFDILGFKDIVRNNKLNLVYKSYKSAQSCFKEIIDHINAISKQLGKVPLQEDAISFHIFSDTFLVHTSKVSDRDFLVLLTACDSLFLAGHKNKLQIRGATSVGELIVADGIEIGKPIIDSYENEQRQDWIGCWITKECIKNISKQALDEHLKSKSILKYEIPMKDGKVKHEYAFNWVKSIPNIIKHRESKNEVTLEEIKKEMKFYRKAPTEWSAKRKHENTMKFIDFVLSPEFIKEY